MLGRGDVGWWRPASHAGKWLSLILSRSRREYVLMPTTSGVAYSASADTRGRITRHELASRNRCAPLPATRYGRRAPNGHRHPTSPRPRRMADRLSARDVPARRRLRKHHVWRSGKSGGARVPRRVPHSAFALSRSSSGASCRMAHGASSQLLLAVRATEHRVEARFPVRRAGGGEPARRVRRHSLP